MAYINMSPIFSKPTMHIFFLATIRSASILGHREAWAKINTPVFSKTI